MNKEILLISSHSFEGVKSVAWFQELPNISDYDIVILDTPRIFTSWSLAGRLEHLGGNEYSLPEIDETAKKVKFNIPLVREKLVEILEFDVTVYALYAPNIHIGTKIDRSLFTFPDIPRGPTITEPTGSKFITYAKWVLNPHDTFNTNDWCPISISTVVEKGKRILVKDKTYEEYFGGLKGYQYYFIPESLELDELKSAYWDKWKVTAKLNVIAANKVNKPTAIEFIPEFHEWVDANHRAWEELPAKIGGSLVLLPVADIYHTEPHIEVLLGRIRGFKKTPPPEWVSSIEIPGEIPLKNEIATEKRNLETVQSRIRRLEVSLGELREYKGLLFEAGLPLQKVVKATLEELGAAIKPAPVSDILINVGGAKALIEVKGNTKSVHKDDVAQLVTDLMEYLRTTGQEIHGILIGNGWRFQPLEKRDRAGQPVFSRDAIRVAQNHNIGLISTTELYKAFCKTLEEPQYKKEVLDKVINGKGVITFQ